MKKANKGFIKELAKPSATPPKKEAFTWHKNVIPVASVPQATSRRLREFKSAPQPKSSLVNETKSHIDNRRKNEKS